MLELVAFVIKLKCAVAGFDDSYDKFVLVVRKETVDFNIGVRLGFELVIKIGFKVVNRLTGAAVED